MEEQKTGNNALSGIFGNAKKTSIGVTYSAAETKAGKCPNCGAARPADTDLRTCSYCGYSFMQLAQPLIITQNNTTLQILAAADWVFVNTVWSKGAELPILLRLLDIEEPQWETANRHWTPLMHAGDETLYALCKAADKDPFTGKYASLRLYITLNPPATLKVTSVEQYIRILEHRIAAEKAGVDILHIYRQYGLTMEEWAQAANFYTQNIAAQTEQLAQADETAHELYCAGIDALHNRFRTQFEEELLNKISLRPDF
ncbi:zinc ribbon domain-containing protein [Chitinophagaceae bacterium MMS25-I14]